MLPPPTITTRSACSGTVACSGGVELLPDKGERAGALRGRIAVERVMLDAHGAGVPEAEKRIDTVEDLGAPLAVHARHVRTRLFDVLQVHGEETVGQLVDGRDRVVPLRCPPAGVDRGAERVDDADP